MGKLIFPPPPQVPTSPDSALLALGKRRCGEQRFRPIAMARLFNRELSTRLLHRKRVKQIRRASVAGEGSSSRKHLLAIFLGCVCALVYASPVRELINWNCAWAASCSSSSQPRSELTNESIYDTLPSLLPRLVQQHSAHVLAGDVPSTHRSVRV